MRKNDLSRRDWLKVVGAGAAACAFQPRGSAAETDAGRGPHFLLSGQGCGRATGYSESNKIVTSGDRTHVAWLDSSQEGFRVRIRTLDRDTGQWSPTYTVGEGFDNHGGPALTIDSQGFLHVVYYPHHHAMRYRKSASRNDASQWEEEIQFGQRLTYPTLVCGSDDTLYLTARRSFSDRPWHVELWKRPPQGQWQAAGPILQSRHPGYAHFQESLAWGPDHKTLHLCCRFHEKSDGKAYGRLQTVGYLISRDCGENWQHRDGRNVSLPATAESAEALATGGLDHQRILRAGAMAVDRSGRAHVVYSVEENDRGRTFIARPNGDGTWQRIDLTAFLPEKWSSWNLITPGGITFDGRGEMVVAAMVQKPKADEPTWGHPSSEVVQFRSRDGAETFSFAVVSRPDPAVSHWLPNVERPTDHHAVPDDPAILYTAGPPGGTNTDLLSNKVFFTTATQ